MLKKQYMSACALTVLALGLASPASAQVAASASPAPAATDVQSDDTSDQGNIVVTAQGRAQALADVPVAISAVSAETLQNSGANDIRQLNQVAPSLLVSSTGSEANASPRIRGIGTVGDNPGLESSVAVFIDGVYRSRAGIGMNDLGEIDRVEVLRGPQGTLGGRNSTAGLLSIISKAPSFSGISAGGEATYGNYNNIRLAGNINVPLGETVAARVDAVYNKRDGFYYDPANNTDVNNRNRYFVRGQLLFEPSSDLKIRLIGDYTRRKEKCCAATYVDRSVNPYIGNLNDPALPLATNLAGGNNIVNVLTALGQPLNLLQSPGYSRTISSSKGRGFGGVTKDYGFSGQIDYDLGGAKLTSITAYRDYKSDQGSDTDYSAADILYRAANGGSSRQFKTFTQELRLQGEAFGGKLDWLVGGFFANENLTVHDNLRFGSQYGRFATCRVISGGGLAGLYSPTSPSCVIPGVGQATLAGATGASGADIVAGFNLLDSLNDLGTTNDTYKQNSRSYAAFTHNIVHLTDALSLTLGGRYTHERKKFNATFGNDNTVCTRLESSLTDDLTTTTAGTATQIATARALAGALIGLGCQGNSTAELNGVSINSERSESKFTGTAVLSWKPMDDLLVYASFARGYKAGGFNLDRSALKNPIQVINGAPTTTFAAAGGAQALVNNLQFDPETVNAFELGAKYSTGPFSLNVAAFRQNFSNFQLNTFNGTVFLVQNINGCSSSLSGGDRDQNKFAAAPNFNAAAVTTGRCAADDVGYGVRAQGVELEASLVPARDLRVSLGATFTDTKYRQNLVGNSAGAPLDQALRLLPGQRLSNSAAIVTTTSVSFTPPIGDTGLSALFYVDGRMTSDYNTGSDLFPQKAQDGYAIFNARIGLRGREQRWALEFWGQNIFNKDYAQVAFNSPFQEGAATAAFQDPQYPGGRQLFSQFLAEPRTYGVTVRGKF